jgi:O-antigen ligase
VSVSTSSRTAAVFLTAIFLLVTLRPHPAALGQLGSVYYADVLIAILGAGWVLTHPGRLLVPKSAYVLLMIGGLVVAVLAGISGLAAYGPLRTGAAINVLRFGYYVAFIFLATTLAARIDLTTRHVRYLLDVAFVANLFLVVIQAFDPPLLGEFVRWLYGSEKLRVLATGYPRVYGSFFNANWFGAYLVFTFLGWLWLFRSNDIASRGLVVRGILLTGVVLLSGSRTGVIGVAIGALAYVALVRELKPTVVALFVIAGGGLFLVTVGQSTPMLEQALGRFTDLATLVLGRDLDTVATLGVRLDQWSDALAAFVQRPWLGYGDSGLGTGFIPHNSPLALLLAFGALGAFGFAGWFLLVIVQVQRTSVSAKSLKDIRGWFVSFTVALAAMAQAADFVNTSQVLALWFLLAAVVLGQAVRGQRRFPFGCSQVNAG